MKRISKQELQTIQQKFRFDRLPSTDLVSLQSTRIENEDLNHLDLSHIDFSWSEFYYTDLRHCRFDGSNLSHTKFVDCDLSFASFVNSNLHGADLRGCNLSNTNCDGTNFYGAILWQTKLDDLIHTQRTKFFRQFCPEQGYFFGYKKCFNNHLVTLLIPKDARRCSSTTNACRCDKAKVVAITDLDGSGFYTEASSFVDESFIYRLGEMIYADSYHEDRWLDSSHGIHFWMSVEEAIGYL